jgi:cGMP-dependent 3',5'-cyclic phosphodiesterase
MRAVALMIAICDEPNQKQSEQFQWLTKNVQVAADRIIRLEKKNENQERMQGMLKVCGSLIDLDVSLLLLKIQTHIKQQLSCDSSVIMTIDESDDELVCMAFDESPLDEEIRLPISDCIYGSCILSGDILQIDNVSEDPRINPNIDFINGYEPYNILCVPIKCRRTSINTTLSVIGVAVAFNKKEGFNSHDQDNIGFIVKFSSSMLVNTLSFKHEIGLKQQNEALLSVAKSLFQKLNDTNTLLHSVMEQARDLTKAEKCSLFLVDKETQELVAVVFDSELPNKRNSKSFRIPIGQGIAGFVAQSGKTVNIRDAYRHPQFYKEVDKSTGFVTRNILCIPIIDHSGVVGVAELVNKKNGQLRL